jgi:O-acetyl-ADP-ribose deacetylase (regulator of RNase III)
MHFQKTCSTVGSIKLKERSLQTNQLKKKTQRRTRRKREKEEKKEEKKEAKPAADDDLFGDDPAEAAPVEVKKVEPKKKKEKTSCQVNRVLRSESFRPRNKS